MRIAAIFEKLKGGVNLAPAGDCQRKAIQVSGTSWISSSSTKRLVKFITVSGGFQNSGSWTVNADVDEGVTCKVHFVGYGTIDKSLNTRYYGCAPSSGTATLPFTFDITGVQDSYINEPAAALAIEFAYGDTWGDTDILPEAVQNVTLCGGTEPYSDAENVETAFLRPEEITDDAAIAQAINSKSAVTLKILPGFETWGFCEQTVTYVTIFDLDKVSDRTIFRGRVSGIRNAMDSSGNMVQEITCASTLDFLDDTYSQIFNLYETSVDTWVTRFIASFNRDLCDGYDKRWRGWKKGTVFSGSATPTNSMSRDEDKAFKTLKYWVEKAYFRNTKKIDNNQIEFRERWVNGENYLDVLLKAGTHHQTALLLGDNLKEIAVEQGIETGYYTTVMARSGVCSDGTRITVTVNNSEMLTRYPVSVVVLTNDDIKCTEPMYYVSYSGGTRSMTPSDEQYEAANALLTWAATQAAKLSSPYVRITLTALDLARIGMADYEGFELGDYYPCVCPPLGLTGQEVRITGIRRKLADGKVAELTVETGERLGDVQSSSGLSGMMAQTASIGDRIGENAAAQADIAQTKAEEQTGGIKIVGLSKSDYDDIPNKDSNTIYKVDNSGTNELYIGEDHIDSGGGGGNSYTIENAVVNTSADWTLERQPLPAWFGGSHGAYYSGSPGRIVIQGQRGLFGISYAEITASDVMSEITMDTTEGGKQTARIFINQIGRSSNSWSLTPGVKIVNVDGQGQETPVGQSVAPSAWSKIPLSATVQIGIIINVSRLGQDSGQLRPYINLQMAIMVDSASFDTARSISISGNKLTGYVPWSTAEEHFGTTLIVKTEPSSGGGG